jgi:hypothetical protein
MRQERRHADLFAVDACAFHQTQLAVRLHEGFVGHGDAI